MKLLIVDDSFLLQSRLKKALFAIDETIDIEQAYNCREALEKVTKFIPDIIIQDIELPDGSGINLLGKYKKDYPTIEVIILTNYPTVEFKNKCMELGASEFFDKSNLASLLNSIHLPFNNM